MKVTRTSKLSGKVHTMDIDTTYEQLVKYAKGDCKVQDIFPHLSADEREFIKSGITPEEWAETFPEEEEE